MCSEVNLAGVADHNLEKRLELGESRIREAPNFTWSPGKLT